jgi:DNA-binding transcriptional regulator YiaG
MALSGQPGGEKRVNNRSKKHKKRTHMTAGALEQIRLDIGFDMRAMARSLGLPYRTYQDYEYGNRGIPKKVADAARDLRRRDRAFMKKLRRQMLADIDRSFPAGIPSEVSK